MTSDTPAPAGRRYALITPCRNEADFMRRTLGADKSWAMAEINARQANRCNSDAPASNSPVSCA